MTGSACQCTYNGGSPWEDNCKCGVAPALASALVSGAEHAADQASNLRNETVKAFAQAGASCQPDPHCQMTGSACKCTYNGGSTWEDNCKCGVAPALTSALVSVAEHAADQASNLRNETVKAFAQAGASCQPDPHCQ